MLRLDSFDIFSRHSVLHRQHGGSQVHFIAVFKHLAPFTTFKIKPFHQSFFVITFFYESIQALHVCKPIITYFFMPCHDFYHIRNILPCFLRDVRHVWILLLTLRVCRVTYSLILRTQWAPSTLESSFQKFYRFI